MPRPWEEAAERANEAIHNTLPPAGNYQGPAGTITEAPSVAAAADSAGQDSIRKLDKQGAAYTFATGGSEFSKDKSKQIAIDEKRAKASRDELLVLEINEMRNAIKSEIKEEEQEWSATHQQPLKEGTPDDEEEAADAEVGDVKKQEDEPKVGPSSRAPVKRQSPVVKEESPEDE